MWRAVEDSPLTGTVLPLGCALDWDIASSLGGCDDIWHYADTSYAVFKTVKSLYVLLQLEHDRNTLVSVANKIRHAIISDLLLLSSILSCRTIFFVEGRIRYLQTRNSADADVENGQKEDADGETHEEA